MPAGNSTPAAVPVSTPNCPVVQDLPDIGRGCLRDDGLYVVVDRQGREIGLTHGGDYLAADEGDDPTREEPPPRAPACVGVQAPQPRVVVLYARAFDDADAFDRKKDMIVDLVRGAAGYIHEAALMGGKAGTLKVECEGPRMKVHEVVLPTPRQQSNFATIVEDLKDLGYSSPLHKYWVYFDHRQACACTGMAHVEPDDTPWPSNLNNANPLAGPMYAVNFQYDSPRVMLHELGHTLGAVQDSAPHATGAKHCTDGRDVMCYRDGGRYAPLYTSKACQRSYFDCNLDDYFNVSPLTGSYLEDHWNLGSGYSWFLKLGSAVAP